jgi:hypothetical protein
MFLGDGTPLTLSAMPLIPKYNWKQGLVLEASIGECQHRVGTHLTCWTSSWLPAGLQGLPATNMLHSHCCAHVGQCVVHIPQALLRTVYFFICRVLLRVARYRHPRRRCSRGIPRKRRKWSCHNSPAMCVGRRGVETVMCDFRGPGLW